jgi:hypothetical protein
MRRRAVRAPKVRGQNILPAATQLSVLGMQGLIPSVLFVRRVLTLSVLGMRGLILSVLFVRRVLTLSVLGMRGLILSVLAPLIGRPALVLPK